jgi:hypothetical protein
MAGRGRRVRSSRFRSGTRISESQTLNVDPETLNRPLPEPQGSLVGETLTRKETGLGLIVSPDKRRQQVYGHWKDRR